MLQISHQGKQRSGTTAHEWLTSNSERPKQRSSLPCTCAAENLFQVSEFTSCLAKQHAHKYQTSSHGTITNGGPVSPINVLPELLPIQFHIWLCHQFFKRHDGLYPVLFAFIYSQKKLFRGVNVSLLREKKARGKHGVRKTDFFFSLSSESFESPPN